MNDEELIFKFCDIFFPDKDDKREKVSSVLRQMFQLIRTREESRVLKEVIREIKV